MNYYIITYGCQLNRADSERIKTVLESMGYQSAPKIERADLIVVNMCSIRQSAVNRVYGLVLKFKKIKTQNLKLKTILTGCVLKKDKVKLSKHFDYVLDIKMLPQWPIFFQPHKENRIIKKENCKIKENYLEIKPKYENNFSAFVPIMTGCNNFCSFCVVPYTRNREISRPVKKIILEIKNLVKKGYKEIWLLGQNVNSYRGKITIKKKNAKNQTECIGFSKLLKMVNEIEGNFWIRFTSPHPKDFSKDLIKVMKNCEKYGHYLNLPVQSGDNTILKKMNRKYTIKDYKNLIKEIRKEIPDITLSTDVIVGFPGETKKQFENTVKLFNKIKYDMAYIAEYSPRPQTLAAIKLKDNVSLEEKTKRRKILTEILRKTALENNQKYLKKIVEVLIEKRKKKNVWLGKTKEYKTIEINSNKNLLGKFVKVKVIKFSCWGLKGKLCQKNLS